MYIWYICILSIFCIHMFSSLVRSSERSCASSSTLAQSGRVVSGSLSHWEKASAVIGWWCALSCGRDSIRWGHQSGNPIRWGHLGSRVKLRRGPLPISFEIGSGAWPQIRGRRCFRWYWPERWSSTPTCSVGTNVWPRCGQCGDLESEDQATALCMAWDKAQRVSYENSTQHERLSIPEASTTSVWDFTGDVKGIEKIVSLVGGSFGQVELEKRFEIAEKALYRCPERRRNSRFVFSTFRCSMDRVVVKKDDTCRA